MSKIELNTVERMLLQRVLQEVQSDWAMLRVKRVLVEQLSPSKKELAKLVEKKEIDGKKVLVYHWDAVEPKNYEIPEAIQIKITKKLDELSKAEKLTDDWYSLMCKFFPEKEE